MKVKKMTETLNDNANSNLVNERAVRAAAGLFLFFGMIAFMNAWLMGNFNLTRTVVIAFLIDFSIRIFIHPRFAPSIIIGQWAVKNQIPEYVSLKPKKVAWGIGLFLSAIMFYTMVLNSTVGPINVITCGLCLIFLWLESSFGICVGCRLYAFFTKQPLENCPGGVCQFTPKEKENFKLLPLVITLVFIGGLIALNHFMPAANLKHGNAQTSHLPVEERCKVPSFAKAMGHEERWKQHNGCQ